MITRNLFNGEEEKVDYSVQKKIIRPKFIPIKALVRAESKNLSKKEMYLKIYYYILSYIYIHGCICIFMNEHNGSFHERQQVESFCEDIYLCFLKLINHPSKYCFCPIK